ncbi:hypothetical protein [Haloplanus sp. HW8-1]|uniref:hypothetical protein n=1 Tax=Haloplanus pelagicus TaxID=2949995 RepID=UPI002040DA8E|nr:hypothetical protein [Haloplanus sp. HW8-1]
MEGTKRVVSRDIQILRGFAYPPLRRVWFDRETVLMALTDSRSVFSTTSETYHQLKVQQSPSNLYSLPSRSLVVMSGLGPTETTDRSITVVLLDDSRERRDCSSYEEAIAIVKDELESGVVAKIENREGDIVFTSAEMSIDDWEIEWRQQKRRLSVETEEHVCPYDSVGCVFDDLCVQCKMDKVRDSV